jgi:histone deacetylase complex subunit SAP18
VERGKEPREEVQVYTWMDATLRELTELIQEVQPAARRAQARLEFALVYPDRRGRNVLREARALAGAAERWKV